MGVTYKMGADVSGFKQGMQQAQQSVKTLDAQLKLNEKQLKANGDAELYMSNKAKLLDKQLEAQQKVVSGLYKQLDEMKKKGVDETSEAYQKLERSIYNAAGKMMDIQAEINSLTATEQKAAAGASAMEQNLSSINRKVSFDAVIKGVDSITSGLEKAAKKAISVGEAIFDDIKTAAKWADDSVTIAEMYEIPLDRYLRMQKLYDEGLDTSVDAILSSTSKIKKNIGKESSETMKALQDLGLIVTESVNTGYGKVEQTKRMFTGSDDLFWKAGQALMNMSNAYDKEAAAQAIFGRSWRELIPLFDKYGSLQEYNEALDGLVVNSEDSVSVMAELSDRLSKLESSWNTLKFEVLAGVAPALEKAADAISGLLDNLTQYLNTDAGQEMLKRLGDAVSGLFDDLKNIDPEDVVNNFVTLFDKLVKAFEWIDKNWNGVKIGLASIVGVITAGKVISGATTLLNLINGLKTFSPTPTPSTPSGNPTGQPTTEPTTGGGAKWSLWTAAQGLLADAGTSLTGILGGSAISAAMFYAIAKGATGGNIKIEMVDDPYRYNNVENAEIIQTAVRGILGTNANSQDQAKWQLGWMAANLGTKNFFDTFNYTDANRGAANYLIDILGKEGTNQQKAAIWYMWQSAYGNPSDRYNVRGREAWDQLTSEQQRALQYGQEQYAALEQLGQLDLGSWIADMKQFFSRSGMFDENGKWWIPSEYEKSQEEQAAKIAEATEVMATLPQEIAAAIENANITVVVQAEGKANGMFSVPWDGYPAILHKGERILSRAMASRNYNSNLYVENMNMGGGMDAQALAAAMAAQNRRISAGFGS